MRRTLAAVLPVLAALAGCGKHRDGVTAAARDTVPITITTGFPGASPAMIAASVTTPIERELGQLAGLAALHSRSTEGRSVVIAELAAGTDVDAASQAVQKALAAAAPLLPDDLPAPPTFTRASRKGAVLRLTLGSKTLSLVEVAGLARDVVGQKLAQVAGVGAVAVCGPEAETRITIDPAALAANGKTIADLRSAILNAGTTPLADLPIVRDTARVETGASDPSCVAIGLGNKRVVAVTVTPQSGAEPLEVRERLEALVPKLTAQLPADVYLDLWPRTRPVAYELLLNPSMSRARTIERLERVFTELHLWTRWLVELGDPEGEPEVAELRILMPTEHADDVASEVVPAFTRAGFPIRDGHDHLVGFSGADPDALRRQAESLVTALASVHGLQVVEQLGAGEQPRPTLTLDRDRAATLGISASEVAATLRVLAPGAMWATTLFTQLDQRRVMLAVAGELPEVIGQVMVRSSTGSLVPLSAVASVTETREPTVIFHEGQFPWIGVRVAGSLDALQGVLAKLPVPAGVRREVREPD